MRIRSILPLLVSVLAAAACGGDSPTTVTPSETSLTFEYRLGSETAWRSFQSRGLQPAPATEPRLGAWVYRRADGGSLYVLARHQPAPGAWVTFYASIPAQEGARVDMVAPGTPCTGGRLCITSTVELVGGTPEICRFSEGGYVVGQVSDAWFSATFSGRGTCRAAGVERTFEVRNGSMDVERP